jgi:hypothetical protein
VEPPYPPPAPPAAAAAAAGLPSSSLQWGAWATVGMVAGSAAVHRAMKRAGLGMVQAPKGLSVLARQLAACCRCAGSGGGGAPAAALAAISFEWREFLRAPRHAAAFFYAGHLPAAAAASEAAGEAPAAHASGASAAERRRRRQQQQQQQGGSRVAPPSLQEVLQQVLAAVAAVHGGCVEPEQPLAAAGLDSLGEWGLGRPEMKVKRGKQCLHRSLTARLPLSRRCGRRLGGSRRDHGLARLQSCCACPQPPQPHPLSLSLIISHTHGLPHPHPLSHIHKPTIEFSPSN